MGHFLERLKALAPDLAWEKLPAEAAPRLDRFEQACPLYARTLEQNPGWVAWLETPHNLHAEFRFQALLDEWAAFRGSTATPDRLAPDYPGTLRRFRRKMSMRIAYRDVADLAPGVEIVEDLTRLAQFCLREAWFIANELWKRRLGEPWDERRDRPSRFCVLGLGKLGGCELNFSSDIDVIYLYSGSGYTVKNGKATSTTCGEFFHRIGETITQLLNEKDGDGFMFRTDLRLRPGGALAPLVPSLSAMEVYYGGSGQTWERLALLKARPVAADLSLGAELLESLQSFRYPRHAPPSLLAEVAAMKQRTEREIVGAGALDRDVKSGFGGIREIEFLTQVLQLLHAGRFPFLQTNSTIEALTQLARYDLLEGADVAFLQDAYWFLRRIEHRIQMIEERQSHELPADPGARASLASTLGFASLETFDAKIAAVRARVRERYAALFKEAAPAAATAADAWWTFFAQGRTPAVVRAKLAAWFGDAPDAPAQLRVLVRESETRPLLRDQVARFADLVPALDRIAPRLGRPIETLRRISRFGESYASRAQFLSACAMNPEFFATLALLFDRSTFIADLLRQHPEIFEEVLRPEILRKHKDAAIRARELAGHPGEPSEEFLNWLWLYHRAESVRTAVCELLGVITEAEAARELTALAESLLLDVIRRTTGSEAVLIIAVGAFGGGELSFGSDLDLLFVAPDEDCERLEPAMRALLRQLGPADGRDGIQRLDLRLRPHGDVGPLIAGFEAMRRYHAQSAQTWERQTLTRARIVAGPAELVAQWEALVETCVYAPGLTSTQAREITRMQERIHTERGRVDPPERAFKTAAGGLIDIEFAAQALLLCHGAALPSVRSPNTAEAWQRLADAGVVAPSLAGQMRENLQAIKRIEWALRRDANRGVAIIPEEEDGQRALARWLDAPSWDDLWGDHRRRMQETRTATSGLFSGLGSAPALERGR